MTVMQIAISDELKAEFERAFPGETIEQAVQRLLQAEIERGQKSTSGEQPSLVDLFRDLASKFGPVSNADIRRAREEGRP